MATKTPVKVGMVITLAIATGLLFVGIFFFNFQSYLKYSDPLSLGLMFSLLVLLVWLIGWLDSKAKNIDKLFFGLGISIYIIGQLIGFYSDYIESTTTADVGWFVRLAGGLITLAPACWFLIKTDDNKKEQDGA